MQSLSFCYYDDSPCKDSFMRHCNNECNLKFCKEYAQRQGQNRANIQGSKDLYDQEVILTLQRSKKRQSLRLEYDNKKIEKIEELALDLKRNAIFDSIQAMESVIYTEQRNLVKNQEVKDKLHEEDLMKKILEAYLTPENLAKVTDPEILVFE